MKTRTNANAREEQSSLRELSQKCSETLDKSVDTYKSIKALDSYTEKVKSPVSNEIGLALDDMESVIVHLASASSGGDISNTRKG